MSKVIKPKMNEYDNERNEKISVDKLKSKLVIVQEELK